MPVAHINVTDIAHDDKQMEQQLLEDVSRTLIPDQDAINTKKTGRKMVLDSDWTTLTAPGQGFHTVVYRSDIEFILIKTTGEFKFQRIVPVDAGAEKASIKWDSRTGEQYYIFKVDPAQKVVICGDPTVRFVRSIPEEEDISTFDESKVKTPLWKRERDGRPWEAEDVYQERDVVAEETLNPEHLAEVARRFKAWMAMKMERLFVFMMMPERLSEREWIALKENGIHLFDDVPWILEQ